MLKHYKILVALMVLGILSCTTLFTSHANSVNTQQDNRVASYDISQWQGSVNDAQAKQLKNEVHFMILKAENGGNYEDPQFQGTSKKLEQNHIPYGAYDYSVYDGSDQAKGEADELYARAPKANFYVNDCEENDTGSDLNTATQAWANEMHQLTKKPVVLYSNLSFMNGLSSATRNAYNALWVAAYGPEPTPSWHYDLWQYTDSHYSPALGQSVDASVIPDKGRNITFWTGKVRSKNIKSRRIKHIIRFKPRSHQKHHRHFHLKRITKIKRIKPLNKKHKYSPKQINSMYYQSSNVRHLRVVDPHGICLYNLNGQYLRHIKIGSILHVKYFRKYLYTKNIYMTRAVDFWHHKWVMYTARKSKLYPYYYGRKK